MALLDDIKLSLRVTADVLDAEVEMLIAAALYDMERAGVNPALLETVDGDLENAFVKNAVTAYCKAQFGYDNQEATRFNDSYERILNRLLNSKENIAAMALVPDAEVQNIFVGMTPSEVWRSLSYRPRKDEYRQALEWLKVTYTEDMTNAQLRALLAEACGITEGE